jgi:tripartite-type tricarboxylate transporter receptor subunit TctC
MKYSYSKPALMLRALALGATVALAPSIGIAADYSGKTIQVTIPTKEGGGTDKYGRIFAAFLGKHLPGNPKIIAVNKPGGGGIKASNWFHKNAPTDGTVLMATGGSVQTGFVFGGKRTKFDLLKWNPIVLSPFGICLMARKELGVKGKDAIADVKALRKAGGKQRLLMGDKHAHSSGLGAFVAYHYLGIPNVKPLFGLSSGKRRKAIARGELQLSIETVIKCKKNHKKLKKKGVITYAALGFAKPDGSIGRDPIMPDLPYVGELYEKLNGKKPSGMQWNAIKALINIISMANKGLWLPPGVSKDVNKTYQKTIKAIYKDKKFKKLTRKRFGNNPQSFGRDALAVVKRGAGLDPKVKKWIFKFVQDTMVGS